MQDLGATFGHQRTSTDQPHNPMRTLLMNMAMLAAMLMSPALRAQEMDNDGDKKTPEERAKHHTEMMTKELNLTADQQTKVADINLRFARYMGEVKQLQDKDTAKKRGDVLKEKRDVEFKNVLTADQFARMLKQREKKKEEEGKHQE